MAHSDSTPHTFEIGLVMAGAVSAGAYTAGVMDFLLQALEAWQQAKDSGEADCPPHQVKIKAMSGASAGGMTAAIGAALTGGQFSPVTQVPPSGDSNNKLYDSWVERIDIEPLLGSSDLPAGQRVKSVLDSTVLSEIAQTALDIEPNDRQRPYIADELGVYLSISNLRGVPYSIGFGGQTGGGHELSHHADHMHFVVSRQKPTSIRGLWLNPTDPKNPAWDTLKQAALATGAFPVGLAPRVLHRPVTDYDHREWLIQLDGKPGLDGQLHCRESREIPPRWPRSFSSSEAAPTDYEFVSVDGGLMNNEPLEMARRHLAGPEGYNPRGASDASRAVLLVDPFPHDAPFQAGYEPKEDLISVISGMFVSLMRQARFKPDELTLAVTDNVYSRFLIAPSRYRSDGNRANYPIACGTLNGFGGFLSVDFRRHDFRLGRRNCQHFLRKYFALPESANNPLFANWTDAMKEKYRFERDGQSYLPIIPLMDSVSAEEKRLPWPKYPSAKLEDLRKQVSARIKLVSDRMLRQYLSGWLATTVNTALWRRRNALVNSVMERIESDLQRRGLLGP